MSWSGHHAWQVPSLSLYRDKDTNNVPIFYTVPAAAYLLTAGGVAIFHYDS